MDIYTERERERDGVQFMYGMVTFRAAADLLSEARKGWNTQQAEVLTDLSRSQVSRKEKVRETKRRREKGGSLTGLIPHTPWW